MTIWRMPRIHWAIVCALLAAGRAPADTAPLGGFIPFVGIGLTRQFETFDTDPTGAFFIADPEYSWSGIALGAGGTPFFDLALLDTGAATHILTEAAASAGGFGIATPFSGEPDGFRGTNFQTIFGASGSLDLRISDPLGVYAGGLANSSSDGGKLSVDTSLLRGQSSFALLEAPAEWELPNIIGLPMAAHHGIAIRNDQPLIFEHQGRTVRTPNIEFITLGTGNEEQIARRADLRLRPSASFLQGPFYLQGGDIFNLELHEDPLSPSVMENGGLYVEVDLLNAGRSLQDTELLFDTGADLTVVSEATAARLGFDVVLDEPDFVLEVEGAGGVTPDIPGFYLDELNIDTVGGSFTLQNVPIAVLDLPNPNDPANVVDGILGMNVFSGRNLVIDANPAASPSGGAPPRLYIGDPVFETHTWASTVPSGALWSSTSNWSAAGIPDLMWDAQVRNTIAGTQYATVAGDSTVYRLTVGRGTAGGQMNLVISAGSTLTTYGETLIEEGGQITLAFNVLEDARLDAQFVNIDGGTLAGDGEIFVGTGPVNGVVRNLTGRVDPSSGAPLLTGTGRIHIIGDLANLQDATIAIDLVGTMAAVEHDVLSATRNIFLAGTLEVSLGDNGSGQFKPGIGDAFTIISAGDGIFGTFDELLLPGGYTWDIAYNQNDVVLTVAGLGLAGDFNGDGTVDAADYIIWRKNAGSAQEYQDWRTNYGATSGGGSSASPVTSAPEPGSVALLAIALCGVAIAAQRRAVTQRVPSAGSKSSGVASFG